MTRSTPWDFFLPPDFVCQFSIDNDGFKQYLENVKTVYETEQHK